MLFNSYIFILLFLPLALGGWFLINRWKKYKLANAFLIGMSLWFYGYFNPYYLWIICGSIVVNFALSKVLNRSDVRDEIAKLVLAVGIVANIGCIFYFKYFDFFITNVNAVFGKSFELKNIVLPLGISFFTFQQVSYLVDSYRKQTKEYSFLEYALFVVFFPQLVAGPIVLHDEMIPQFRNKESRIFRQENFAKGLYIFAQGLFKKVLIADTFAKAVTLGFGMVDSLSSMEAILVSFAYTFQLYFDFSGYCDMAVGIGHMFNISLPQNFNSPYKSISIMEFWERWHMSLTRFLREYIYFPLGGSKKGKVRTYVNVMIVFLVSGIWHGANWTFVIWGFLHGILNCLNRGLKKYWEKVWVAIRWVLTFAAVNILWVIFRADSVGQAFVLIKKMIQIKGFQIGDWLTESFDLIEFVLVERLLGIYYEYIEKIPGFHMWCFFLLALGIVLIAKNSSEKVFKPTITRSVGTIIMMMWSILSLSGISVFLYFNF